MLVYLAKRGAARLSLLFGAGVVIFLLTRPLIADATPGATLPAAIVAMIVQTRSLLGSDVAILTQFAEWTMSLLGGDFGRSAAADASTLTLIRQRLPVTLHLIAGGLALALVVALPVGLLAAARPGRALDRASRVLVFVTQAMPMAGVSLVLMLVFAILLRWLPAGGHVDPTTQPVRALAHLLLPAGALAIGLLPMLLCAIRDGARAAHGERHLDTARASGVSPRRLIWGRTLRLTLAAALVPIASLAGQMMSGAILVEAVFDLPGVGRLVIESLDARDYGLLRGLALASVMTMVATALAGDVLRGLLDRRIRSAS